MRKRGNARGAKGPCRIDADAREKEYRLSHHDSTTGERGPAKGYLPGYAGGYLLPEALSSLRRKLYQKSEREPEFRFYTLYGRILRPDVLRAAYDQVKRRKGAPGTDGISIEQIESAPDGPQTLVATLHEELKTKRYTPRRVKPPQSSDPTPLSQAERTELVRPCANHGSGLASSAVHSPCMTMVNDPGAPDAGNPHVRCDEGGRATDDPRGLRHRHRRKQLLPARRVLNPSPTRPLPR